MAVEGCIDVRPPGRGRRTRAATRVGRMAALLLVAATVLVGASLRSRPVQADTLPSQAGTTLYATWLDAASPSFSSVAVHLVNPGPGPATGTVSLAGGWSASFSLAPAAATYVGVPRGVIGGP